MHLKQIRLSYSVHYGSPETETRQDDRPYATREEAKAARDKKAKELREAGYKVRRSILKNQLRKYWGFGSPCGITSDCFEIYAER